MFLTTVDSGRMIRVVPSRGAQATHPADTPVSRPEVMDVYNKHKGAVDTSDQMVRVNVVRQLILSNG
jgi:hypothetical protein